VRVLMLSGHEESLFAERAVAAGAMGYIMKDEPFQVLLEAVHSVRDGKVWLSEEIREQLVPPARRVVGSALQVEIVRALQQGRRSTAELTSSTDASAFQVQVALQTLQEQLGVSSRAGLILWLDSGGEVVAPEG
jgi:DNA-binding NarL/FixJ family response regulator